MGNSYSSIRVHAMFHKKYTAPPIHPDLMTELCPFIGGTLKKLECMPIIINGVDDHVHLLFILNSMRSIAEVIREVKKRSSVFIKTKGDVYNCFEWQSGYAAYSVSKGQEQKIFDYIASQQTHHTDKTKTFDYEFRFFLKRNGFDPNGPYVLTD